MECVWLVAIVVMLCWSGSAHGQGGSFYIEVIYMETLGAPVAGALHTNICVYMYNHVWLVAVVVILDHNNSTVSLSFWWVMHVYRH